MIGRTPDAIPLSRGMLTRLVATGLMVILQLTVGVIMAISTRTTVEFMGIFTCIVSFISLYGWVKQDIGVVFGHFVYSIGYLLALLTWSIVYWSDFVDKCIDNVDLYQRWSPETINLPCATIGLQSVVLVVLLVLEILIVLSSYMMYNYLWRKQKPALTYDADEFNQDEPLVPQQIVSIASKGRVKLVFKLSFGIAAVAIFVITLILVSPVIPVDYNVPGVGCPVGPDFLPHPMQNELACCEFHNPATCCRRSHTGADKRTWQTYDNMTLPSGPSPCDDILGLLSCAPCRPDSCTFTNRIDGIDRMCSGFCTQVFKACQDIPIYNSKITVQQWYHNDSKKFCEEAFSTHVIPEPKTPPTSCDTTIGCYSPADAPRASMMLLILMLIGILFWA